MFNRHSCLKKLRDMWFWIIMIISVLTVAGIKPVWAVDKLPVISLNVQGNTPSLSLQSDKEVGVAVYFDNRSSGQGINGAMINLKFPAALVEAVDRNVYQPGLQVAPGKIVRTDGSQGDQVYVNAIDNTKGIIRFGFLRNQAQSYYTPAEAGELGESIFEFTLRGKKPGSGVIQFDQQATFLQNGLSGNVEVNLPVSFAVKVTPIPPVIPAPPSNLWAAIRGLEVVWNWSDNSGDEKGFKLYDADSQKVVGTVKNNIVTFTERNLKSETTFRRYIAAYNDGGASPRSTTVSITTPPVFPRPPDSFRGKAVGNRIVWTWSDRSDNEKGFQIFDDEGRMIANLSAGVTSYTEEGLSLGIEYVRVIKAYGTAGYSSGIKAKVWTKPEQAKGLIGAAVYEGIQWSWPEVKSAKGYYMYDANGFKLTSLSRPGYKEKIKDFNRTYTRVISAYNISGEGELSAPVTFQPGSTQVTAPTTPASSVPTPAKPSTTPVKTPAKTQPAPAVKIPAATVKISFTDTNGHWANNDITYLATRGLVNGGNGKFRPNEPITRAEFTKMVLQILDFELDKNETADYGDVKDQDWYSPWIAAAARGGGG